MPKLYSNPWKDRKNFKHKAKYYVRDQFYKFLLRKYCKGCKTVLDVACGPGHFMKLAEKMGFKSYGVELDERYKAKNVFIKDLWKFNRKFDVVFNSFILEHVDDQQKFVDKMAALSNNIVITITAYLSKSFYDVPDHKKPATKVGIRWMFRRAGFRNILSIHVPFYKAVIVVSKKVTAKDKDKEAMLIKQGFW